MLQQLTAPLFYSWLGADGRETPATANQSSFPHAAPDVISALAAVIQPLVTASPMALRAQTSQRAARHLRQRHQAEATLPQILNARPSIAAQNQRGGRASAKLPQVPFESSCAAPGGQGRGEVRSNQEQASRRDRRGARRRAEAPPASRAPRRPYRVAGAAGSCIPADPCPANAIIVRWRPPEQSC